MGSSHDETKDRPGGGRVKGPGTDIFNYVRISLSNAVHRFDKSYTRRLCGTLEELREMPQDEIDAKAYGAYMDGAK